MDHVAEGEKAGGQKVEAFTSRPVFESSTEMAFAPVFKILAASLPSYRIKEEQSVNHRITSTGEAEAGC